MSGAFLNRPAQMLALWLLLMSGVLFAVMALDKHRAAQRGGRRIPERRLFLLAVLGGAAGGWSAMLLLRHKTKRPAFMLGFPLLTLFQLAFFIYLTI